MRRDAPDVIEPTLVALPWTEPWDAESVIRLLEPLVVDERRARLASVFEQRIGSVTLLMDAPHDPHNGAAVLRSCDAFGVQVVHVVPREEEFVISRTVASGTERWVDVVRHLTPSAAVAALAARGFELVATHPAGELLPEDLAGIPRLALVMGNEHDGISAELAACASRSVRIPMRGFVESLNVSVSAALLLRAATRERPADLSPTERRLLYARGLFHTVPRASEVLAASTPRP
jgi:tRNA (guanosine-2'-O-)-methyltransferase